MPIRVLFLGQHSAPTRMHLDALPERLDCEMVLATPDIAAAGAALAASRADLAIVAADFAGAPSGAGFDLIAALPSALRPVACVFVSSREEDAVRAFELEATDFLTEPMARERFENAVARARQSVLREALLRTADELQRLIAEASMHANGAGHAALFGAGNGGATNGTMHNGSAPFVAAQGGTAAYGGPQYAGGYGSAVLRARGGDASHANSHAHSHANGNAHANASQQAALAAAGWHAANGDANGGTHGIGKLPAPGRDAPRTVLVREGRRTRFVPLADIDWFEADGNYIVVHAGTEQFRTRGTIASIEAGLDPRQFARIHRRIVVNMDRVRELSPLPGGDGLLKLGGGATLRLSRTYRARVR